MPIIYQAKNLKPMLQFLVDHDYDFQRAANESTIPESEKTFASQLTRREIKANHKIAGLIEKIKRSHTQMSFYDKLAKGDLATQLKNTVVRQNDLLKLLQTEPDAKSYQIGLYQTQLGQGSTTGGRGADSMDTKFFVDNKAWILKEVAKFLDENQDEDEQERSRKGQADDESQKEAQAE